MQASLHQSEVGSFYNRGVHCGWFSLTLSTSGPAYGDFSPAMASVDSALYGKKAHILFLAESKFLLFFDFLKW